MHSLDLQMRRHGGRLSGGGLARLLLLLAVIAAQSLDLANDRDRFMGTPLWLMSAFALPTLFALGGMTVARAACEATTIRFLVRRFFRLWPPLAVSVLISALVIGPLMTGYPLADYVAERDFADFFLNLAAWPHLYLPGLFETNAVSGIVNGFYAALPVTVICLLCALAAAQFQRRRARFILLCTLLLLLAVAIMFPIVDPSPLGGVQTLPGGRNFVLLFFFLTGMLAYHARTRIPVSPLMFVTCGVAGALAATVGNPGWTEQPAAIALLAPIFTYMVIWVSSSEPNIWGPASLLHGCRHEILLLSYPVQQSVAAVGGAGQGWIANLLLSLPVILVAATASHQATRFVLARMAPALSADLDGAERPGGDGRQLRIADGLARHRRKIRRELPMLGFWLVLVLIAMGLMGILMIAMQRGGGGV